MAEVKASCATGLAVPSNGSPLMFGNSDPGSCDTTLDAVETDTCDLIYIGGKTKSNTLANYPTAAAASCLSTSVGFIA